MCAKLYAHAFVRFLATAAAVVGTQPPVSAVTVIPSLDIFKVDPYGNVRWLEPAGDMEAAKAWLEALGTAMPGHVVLSQKKLEK